MQPPLSDHCAGENATVGFFPGETLRSCLPLKTPRHLTALSRVGTRHSAAGLEETPPRFVVELGEQAAIRDDRLEELNTSSGGFLWIPRRSVSVGIALRS